MNGLQEQTDYLTKQLITCIGNKRSLIGFIGKAIDIVKIRLGKDKLALGDFFAGSGVVSRYFKSHASKLVSNDLETYAEVLARCYLSNREDFDDEALRREISLMVPLIKQDRTGGFLSELYAPADDDHIRSGERVFFTRRNALYLDAACRMIEERPGWMRPFLLGPLLSEASIHANTSGVFKGFYKDGRGVGCFGGRKGDAIERIKGEISLQMPVLSRFSCPVEIYRQDASSLADRLEGLDLVYLDPPYNQHPYGSNYFMLNLIADYRRPDIISTVSGIPRQWNRSKFNSRNKACATLFGLIESCKASHILVSYNSEGFVPHEEFLSFMQGMGRLKVMETPYNTFRGSRNLRERPGKVKEYLYLLERR